MCFVTINHMGKPSASRPLHVFPRLAKVQTLKVKGKRLRIENVHIS